MMQNDDEINLWKFLTVLTKHKKLIIAVMALSVGLGLLVSFTATKYYLASAVVRNGFFFEKKQGDAGSQETAVLKITDLENFLRSRDILEPVLAEANLKLDYDSLEYFRRKKLRITPLKNSFYVRVEVETTSPELSRRIAELLLEKYIAHGNAIVGKILDPVKLQFQELENQITIVNSDIRKSRAAWGVDSRVSSNGVTVLRLQETLPQMQANLQSLLAAKSELQSMLLRSGDFRIIDRPEQPQSPSKPNKKQILLLAILAGMVISAVAVMIAEHINS